MDRLNSALVVAVILCLIAAKLATESSILRAVDLTLFYSSRFSPSVLSMDDEIDASSMNLRFDQNVSIIITSSLIPTHPDLSLIVATIRSLELLKGLPTSTPIWISVDGIPAPTPKKPLAPHAHERLAQYIQRLETASFHPFTNVTVLTNDRHLHIAGSVQRALEYVDTHFVYLLQHDLRFNRTIQHYRLLQAMTEHPDRLRNIRFRLKPGVHFSSRGTWPLCDNQTHDWNWNGLQFFPTALWSDNNQLSTKQYYQQMFKLFKRMKRPMEWEMTHLAKNNCSLWGQQLYGGRYDPGYHIVHLDGRLTEPGNVTR